MKLHCSIKQLYTAAGAAVMATALLATTACGQPAPPKPPPTSCEVTLGGEPQPISWTIDFDTMRGVVNGTTYAAPAATQVNAAEAAVERALGDAKGWGQAGIKPQRCDANNPMISFGVYNQTGFEQTCNETGLVTACTRLRSAEDAGYPGRITGGIQCRIAILGQIPATPVQPTANYRFDSRPFAPAIIMHEVGHCFFGVDHPVNAPPTDIMKGDPFSDSDATQLRPSDEQIARVRSQRPAVFYHP